MPSYRIASLTPEQMRELERMEHQLGVTLVAYQPGDQATGAFNQADAGTESDAINGLNPGAYQLTEALSHRLYVP